MAMVTINGKEYACGGYVSGDAIGILGHGDLRTQELIDDLKKQHLEVITPNLSNIAVSMTEAAEKFKESMIKFKENLYGSLPKEMLQKSIKPKKPVYTGPRTSKTTEARRKMQKKSKRKNRGK